MKKMSFRSIFNWLYAKTLDRAMSDRRPREDRETISPVYRLVSVSYVARISLVALLLLVLGGWNSEAWAGQAHVYVYSSPQDEGYVYVATSNSAPSTYTLTKDHAEQGGIGSSGNKTFYLFYQAKSGYHFENWYKTSENNYNNGTTVTNTSSLTSQGQKVTQSATGIGAQNSYYAAVFKGNSYTISFDGNDATRGTMSNQTGFVYGTEKQISGNAFYREYTVGYNTDGGTLTATPTNSNTQAAYTFAGWNTDQTAQTADSDALKDVYANRTVYAVFTAEELPENEPGE